MCKRQPRYVFSIDKSCNEHTRHQFLETEYEVSEAGRGMVRSQDEFVLLTSGGGGLPRAARLAAGVRGAHPVAGLLPAVLPCGAAGPD